MPIFTFFLCPFSFCFVQFYVYFLCIFFVSNIDCIWSASMFMLFIYFVSDLSFSPPLSVVPAFMSVVASHFVLFLDFYECISRLIVHVSNLVVRPFVRFRVASAWRLLCLIYNQFVNLCRFVDLVRLCPFCMFSQQFCPFVLSYAHFLVFVSCYFCTVSLMCGSFARCCPLVTWLSIFE